MKSKKEIIVGIILAILIILASNKSMATTATVNTDTLKLRKEASTDSDVLSLLNLGEKLEVIEKAGDWYKVKVNNKTGYVHKDYIKLNEEVSTTNNVEKNNAEQSNTEQNNENKNSVEQNDVENTTQTTNTQTPTETTVIEEQQEETNNQNTSYINKELKIIKDTNCYILPLINSNILTNLKKDSKVTIKSEVNGWIYVETEELTGWILTSSVDIANLDTQSNNEQVNSQEPKVEESNKTEKTEEQNTQTTTTETKTEEPKVTPVTEKTMYVNTASIYMRKGAGTNYEVVDSLILNSSVIVTGEINDWYQVKVSGKTGYIAKRLLSSKKTEESTTRSSEERTNNQEQTTTNNVVTSKGEEVVNYAKQYLKCKYVYGASGPSTFDCSGFTMYVFKHFGISLSHSATAQSKKGTYVAKENLQPGDLVFFKDYQTMDGIGHCGIYVGDGNFIHASSGTGYCVKLSTLLTGSYNTRYSTARRII